MRIWGSRSESMITHNNNSGCRIIPHHSVYQAPNLTIHVLYIFKVRRCRYLFILIVNGLIILLVTVFIKEERWVRHIKMGIDKSRLERLFIGGFLHKIKKAI